MNSLFILLALSAPAFAAISYVLPGTTEQTAWNGLSNANHTPTSSTTSPWGPIASNTSATFAKVSGPSYFYSAGIYGWHTAGSVYSFVDEAPISGLSTLILQGRFNQAPLSVTLSLNGGSQNLGADFTATQYFAPGGMGGGTVDDYAWQWDLSSYAGTISNYTITFSAPPSTVIYSTAPLTIDAGNTFAQVIPEPSAALLGLTALAFTGVRRRRA